MFKKTVAAVLIILFPTVCLADDFDQRMKDNTLAKEICAKHLTSINVYYNMTCMHCTTIGGGFVQNYPESTRYQHGWEKCYVIDSMADDLRTEKDKRDLAFIQKLDNAAH